MIQKRLVSGIKPTGDLTLGNYIGVLQPLLFLQKNLKNFDFYLFIADLHALTFYQEPSQLKKQIKKVAALYLASGLDPKKINLFIQSEIIEHSYLGYLLECNSYFNELQRMIQYKEKSKQNSNGMRTSLFTYPTLMAADILIYDANIVPIGQDQKQHLELTKTLATRFNHLYGNTFTIPEAFFNPLGTKIKGLQKPLKKMSKSETENDKNYILLLDEPEIIKKKIMAAVTDSDTFIKYDPENKPSISNLLTIYSALKKISIRESEKIFQSSSYKYLKDKIYEAVIEFIIPLQKKFYHLIDNPKLDEILNEGAKKARLIADAKIKEVQNKIGIMRF
ncbi:Tryptophanyl-tRNA synthetase [Candidatus Phytoplasma australiense]|uniref:Tryptophan--tRNA ligase n=2 Tax=Phytoplasma australiense TaxID=59748 RepID=B1VAA3_PHYAS|nr:tryptophan--tRNA ligase [Candidatus Phytoplasma australiense]AGL90256.1 Tryptophanyl-tRNA synthetase [Strawberry lethal yellows phytoplasma (CPA) str. NZSb11]CAM11876.1 Tryptophanyl-tRNA synthetase [Candidatus Phytoplasma australiense]